MSYGVRETGADGHWAYVWTIASRTMPEFHRSGAPMSRMQNHARLEGQRGDPNAGIRVPVGPVTSSDFSLPCACTHAPGQKYTSSFFSTARSPVRHLSIIKSWYWYPYIYTKSKVVFRTGPVSRATLSCQSTMQRSDSTGGWSAI
jgi:hypothetical protein